MPGTAPHPWHGERAATSRYGVQEATHDAADLLCDLKPNLVD
jgi:hypothetical protein